MLKSFFAFAKVWWERSYRAETSEDDGSPFSSLEVEFVRIPQIIVCSRLNSRTSSCCSVALSCLSERKLYEACLFQSVSCFQCVLKNWLRFICQKRQKGLTTINPDYNPHHNFLYWRIKYF